jgi:hypothetical protein
MARERVPALDAFEPFGEELMLDPQLTSARPVKTNIPND